MRSSTFLQTVALLSLVSLAFGSAGAGMQAGEEGQDPIALCQKLGIEYGQDKNTRGIDAACSEHFLNAASPSSIRNSEDGLMRVFGHKNILFIQTMKPEATHAMSELKVSGKNSQLQEIKALAVDPANQEIAVIEAASDRVFVFSTVLGGNLSPLRVLAARGLEALSGVAFDSAHQELFVTSLSQNNVQVYSRFANVAGRKPEHSTAVKRKIAGSQTQITSPVAVEVAADPSELLVLDRDSGKILVFDVAAEGNVAPKRVIGGPATKLDRPTALVYWRSTDSIFVSNGNKEVLRFPRKSSGDVAPSR